MTAFYEYDLVIEQYADSIEKCIQNSQYTLIKGPTGCGKSSFVPLLLNKNNRKIAIIEPRRIAVTSLYMTLSKSTNNVGYKMRFCRKVKESDNIVIYTDGAFLNEGLDKHYDYIIVDEVHERSIRIDVILCLLKKTKAKVVLMSATVDTNKLQKFFNASLFEIKKIQYKCETIYTDAPVSDYILESYKIIKEIVTSKSLEAPNDNLGWLHDVKTQDFSRKRDGILVFLTGEEDINELYKLLKKLVGIKVYKIYSNLSDQEQSLIYEQCNTTKVILSTNICETSLTIPDIRYVIDCGLVKSKLYDGINYFGIVSISKESADQRQGRSNRLGHGVCYRLYTKNCYDNLQPAVPEILMADLTKPLLQFINQKIDIFTLNFLDFPSQANVKRSLLFLFDKKLINEQLQITKKGRKIINYPFDINLSCFYYECLNNNIGSYGSMLVSMISLDNYNFIRPTKGQLVTDIKYLITMFDKYINAKDKNEYCKSNELNIKNMDKAHNIYKSLNKSKGGNVDLVEKIFSKVFNYNLAVKELDGGYRHLKSNNKFFIHPTSNFFKKNAKKIVFVDVFCTTKKYVRIVGKYY